MKYFVKYLYIVLASIYAEQLQLTVVREINSE